MKHATVALFLSTLLACSDQPRQIATPASPDMSGTRVRTDVPGVVVAADDNLFLFSDGTIRHWYQGSWRVIDTTPVPPGDIRFFSVRPNAPYWETFLTLHDGGVWYGHLHSETGVTPEWEYRPPPLDSSLGYPDGSGTNKTHDTQGGSQ